MTNIKNPAGSNLDIDLGSGHTAYRRASLSTYVPNFIEIEETFCGRTDIWDPLY